MFIYIEYYGGFYGCRIAKLVRMVLLQPFRLVRNALLVVFPRLSGNQLVMDVVLVCSNVGFYIFLLMHADIID